MKMKSFHFSFFNCNDFLRILTNLKYNSHAKSLLTQLVSILVFSTHLGFKFLLPVVTIELFPQEKIHATNSHYIQILKNKKLHINLNKLTSFLKN